MLTVGPGTRVYVAAEPIDLRRRHDGLCIAVKALLGHDPYAGHLFVFFGRRGDRIKVFHGEKGGSIVYYERLEQGFKGVRYLQLPMIVSVDRVVEGTSDGLPAAVASLVADGRATVFLLEGPGTRGCVVASEVHFHEGSGNHSDPSELFPGW